MGKIVGVFGLRGEVKIFASRIGEDALRPRMRVTLRFAGTRPAQEALILRLRPGRGTLVAAIDGVETVEDANRLIGASLVVPRAAIALGEGEYFDDELVGCRLLQDGREVGVVRAVLHYPAQDMLELDGGAMVPLVAAFVREIDVAAKTVRVALPPGLVEGEPEEA